MFTLLVLQ